MEELFGNVQLERPSHAKRLARHAFAQLACLGSHTITGLLCAMGGQFEDWSADYRLYSRKRAEPRAVFEVVRKELCAMDQGPVVMAMDDTRTRKTGRHIEGATYTRDPMGPPFHLNLMRAQRFVQTSMALKGEDGQARMIPVDWMHAPLPQKPSRKAAEHEHEAYRKLREKGRLSLVGVLCMREMRQWLDDNGAPHRRLWQVVDGSYTNGTVLKQLPHNTTLVGRIHRNARLYYLPAEQPAKGRKRAYGELAPTPEMLRQDESHPWVTVQAFFGGERRELRAKKLGPVRWRAAGQHHDLQVIVIAPTSYRLSKKSKALYREPAYLICTDPAAPLEEVIQHYLWRWDIETNFRDEKSLLGVGEARVRGAAATQNVTATAVAAYAMLLMAAEKCRQHGTPPQHLPEPKWRRKKSQRTTTASLIQNLRYELWSRAIHFSGITVQKRCNTNPEKWENTLPDALFYASRH